MFVKKVTEAVYFFTAPLKITNMNLAFVKLNLLLIRLSIKCLKKK